MTRRLALYGAVFAGAFAITWALQSRGAQREPHAQDRRGSAERSASRPAELAPSAEPGPGLPRVRVVEVAPQLSLKQQMIRDHGDTATATWAVVSQVEAEFFNQRYRATYESSPDPNAPVWPWNCGEELLRGEPPLARLRITATPDEVVASGYRIISAGIDPEVAECVEAYFEGATSIPRRPGAPEFLTLETTSETPAFIVGYQAHQNGE